jgi:pimeloyl-ACP methyl ester carboxylesterase
MDDGAQGLSVAHPTAGNEDGPTTGELSARVGDLELCYERFGEEDDPPLLLIMGLATQMVAWDSAFCAELVRRGFSVIRFDNRDVGRSTILRQATRPTATQLMLRDPRAASYSLDDMADDAAGLLDVLGIAHAHVVGASMGGMIAQLLAIRHPERVLSLTSIMSTTGDRRVGRTNPRLLPRLLRRPQFDRDRYIEEFGRTLRLIGSRRHHDPERTRRLAALCYERGYHPAGAARQLAAIVTAADRTPRLRALSVPTLVIHGAEDELVAPSGGQATAAAIPGSRLLILDDMAHDLPAPLWPQIVAAISDNAERAGHVVEAR